MLVILYQIFYCWVVHSFSIIAWPHIWYILFRTRGLPDCQIQRVQDVHNTAAWVLTLTKKHDHITPVLKSLHWLPVKQRIILKILTLTFKCLTGLAPYYLSELLQPYSPPRLLRSSNNRLLKEFRSRTKSYGDRAFKTAAPKLWNKLPLSIQQYKTLVSFKSQLKHHMFKEPYKRTWTFSGITLYKLYCIVLYYIVLYCIVLYCIVLYCIVFL